MKDFLFCLVVLVGLFAALIAFCVVMASWECHAKWDEAGYGQAKYSVMGGCKVRNKNGQWVPTFVFREVQ